MAIEFTLVDATPYRLRYLATQDGVISSPPDPGDPVVAEGDGYNWIPNNLDPTPDLRTDIMGVAGVGVSGLPLRKPIRARLDGYPPLAAGALTQAQARAIMNSDDAAGAVLTNDLIGRAVCEVTPRTGPAVNWAVDVNVDVGQGDPVVEVRSTTGTAATAYVDIHMRHTYDL